MSVDYAKLKEQYDKMQAKRPAPLEPIENPVVPQGGGIMSFLGGMAKETYKGIVRPLATPFAGIQAGITGEDVQYSDWLGGARASNDPAKQARIVGGAALEAAALIPGGKAVGALGKVGKVPLGRLALEEAKQGAKVGALAASGYTLGTQDEATTADVLTSGAIGAGVGGAVGALSPVVGGMFRSMFRKPIQQATEKEIAEATSKAAGVYRDVLRPTQGEIRKFEVRKGTNLDDVYGRMAKEGIEIGSEGNRLETLDGQEKVLEKLRSSGEKLNDELKKRPEVSHSLFDLADRVKKEIDQEQIPAIERQAKKANVDKIIQAEITEKFGPDWEKKGIVPNVDNLEYNRLKQNMWSMGYNQVDPTANAAARKIGHVIKEDIEVRNPDAAIREINKATGEYADMLYLLQNAHGRVVKGGVLQKRIAGIAGAIAGATTPFPVLGPLVGQQVGEKVFERLADPSMLTKRASEGLMSTLKRQNTVPKVPAPTGAFRGLPGLKPEERAIEQAAFARNKAQLPTILDRYAKVHGKVINVDDFRPFYAGYNGTNAAAVHEPASEAANAYFSKLVQEAKPGDIALFLAGGGGSGKTSAVNMVMKGALESSALTFDGTFAKYDSALRKIEQVEQAGLEAVPIFTMRKTSDAWKNGVVPRAILEGRTVPLSEFYKAHTSSPETVSRLLGEGRNIRVIDNTGPFGSAKFVSSDDFLERKKDLLDISLDELKKWTKEQYEKGEIPPEIYKGLMGGD